MTSLRVVSYNIHGQRDDADALRETVRALAPDVVVIQEAPRRLRWRTKCAHLARSFGLVYAVGGLPSLGNLILTNFRVRVHATWCLQYPLTPGRHMRGAAFARCSVGATPFTVAGSHLSVDATERVGQATRLKKALAEADAPVIFAADLNENSGGAAWRMLADGLTDAAVAAGRADTATFPCADPRERIDAVFVDPRVTVVRYEVVDSAVARRASDHLPIMVDLTLSQPAAASASGG
jgi:endonuclease/exonuclease/phosphatase family metal-dependent hydrolase